LKECNLPKRVLEAINEQKIYNHSRVKLDEFGVERTEYKFLPNVVTNTLCDPMKRYKMPTISILFFCLALHILTVSCVISHAQSAQYREHIS